MTKPISPSEIASTKATTFPPEVFEVFNKLIAEHYSAGRATIKQAVALNRIAIAMNCTHDVVFHRGWMNIEEVYRERGWKVEYDKPGYNESYGAFWVFKG